ncbi:ead/Ea22-like family protein [Raoultella ornithinolytica]|uniref:ead/Ea22-like family protein n=1 Tax=Raoultella ornithinolytica TaxID=54291 RepID=UPI0022587D5C|nr:ead/Ea22-like family protein [Raoultella ornithinolytica]MCX3408805.1 ead/Ea22-like family protein [Raoultella ornithinolytica]
MTTDITELAQSLKAAITEATPGPWYVHDKPCEDGNYGIDTSDKEFLAEAVVWWGFARQSIWREEDAKYIALANPANIRALVEALEKAQQYAKERDAENQDLMLTVGRLRVEREELESRTVKLPEAFYPDGDIDCPLAVNVDDVKDVLTAAGIKWEAE